MIKMGWSGGGSIPAGRRPGPANHEYDWMPPGVSTSEVARYTVYRYYRRYSGIISNRRCFLGVRPNAFQIEDIAECKSSSNDQKSKNKPLNIGMIFGISSIWKSFVPLPFFVFFAGKLPKINRTLTPGPGWPPEEESAKVPPEVGPGRRYFGTLAFGGGRWKWFLSFFDWGMVIQTTFQIEDNL